MNRVLQAIGPALIVAAVVLGPGSILTSSKVGATMGLAGLPVVLVASFLMIAMVTLSARLGVLYKNSLCNELADRLGRPVAIAIGAIVFTLVAIYQSSNNMALIAAIEPLVGDELGFGLRVTILVLVNGLVIGCLYCFRNLYRFVEQAMKLLIGLMTLAFVINFVVVFCRPRDFVPQTESVEWDWLPLLGMIGTTFSVAGAFYQAYLVREKGWGKKDISQGTIDSVVSISVLGAVTCLILLTSYRVFYGNPAFAEFGNVGDVAKQLEPSFGFAATLIFCAGILAGALSSFLVNALIGGTVMSDSMSLGDRLEDRGTLHLTSIALIIGMFIGIATLFNKESTVILIIVAQASTVIGMPALAATLWYLGSRPEITRTGQVPGFLIWIAAIGFLVSVGLAIKTASAILQKFTG